MSYASHTKPEPGKPARVYLALGANLGDRVANLETALDRLRSGPKIGLLAVSGLYETRPVGYAEQPDFLNMAALVETELEPLPLLDYLKQVESELGRQPTIRNGPRPIDLDIIFYNELVYRDERLEIPHPRLRGRGFVLAPLAELAPEYRHPVLKLTVAQLLAEVDLPAEGVRPYTPQDLDRKTDR